MNHLSRISMNEEKSFVIIFNRKKMGFLLKLI